MAEPQQFWSVTSLIGEGVPKPALVGWSANTVATRAWDKFRTLQGFVDDGDRAGAIKWLADARWEKSESAAARGTSVHAIVEAYALGETPAIEPGLEGYAEQIRRFLDDHQPEFEASEAPVYNTTYNYAGTLDMIVHLGGQRVIVDAKTTDKTPDAKSRPPYGEVALQLAAYSRCDLLGLSPPTIAERFRRRYYTYDPDNEFVPVGELDGAFALVVSPVDYLLVPVRIDDEVFRSFLAARAVARFQIEISKRVFGTPPRPKAKAPA